MTSNIIWIKSKCTDYYKLVKKLQFIGIKVLEIKYENKEIYLKVDEAEYEKINKYLVTYKFQKMSNTGLNKIKDILWENKIFVIALIMGIAVFLVLNNLIVDVNIIHENKEIRELLQDELEEYGIKILRFKKKYSELDKIRQQILDKYPNELDWMEFEQVGMKLNVRVEERIITDISKDNKVCDLVAKKAGVINDIVIYEGEGNVFINDYVRPGDVLVKGTVSYNEEAKRYTCASGEVYANTWYTINVSIPYNYATREETGKKKYNLVWEKNGVKKEILRSRFSEYNSYLKNVLKIFDFNLYLETEREVEKIEGKYSDKEALEEGLKKAEDSLKKKLGPNDVIIDKKVLKKMTNDSTMDIDVFIVVKELISTEKEIVIGEGID